MAAQAATRLRSWVLVLALMWLLPALSGGAPTQSPSFLWAQRGGGPTNSTGQAVALDRSGNVLVTGFFMGTCTVGSTNLVSNGLEDIFLAKYDPAGNFLWARQAGGSGYDEGRGLATDGSGNIYLTGLFQGTASFGGTSLTSSGQSDIFIAKYDPSGNLLWARAAGGKDYDEAHAIAVDGQGNCFITGFVDSLSAAFGSFSLANHSGYDNGFVAKCSSAGVFLWVRQITSSLDSQGGGIAVDGPGNVYTSGFFGGTATFGSTTLTAAGTSGQPDAFLLKLDSLGNPLWVRQAGGSGDDEASAVAADAAGNAFVTGKFHGPATFGATSLAGNGAQQAFVAQYDPSGNLLWVQAAGGNNVIYGNSGLGLAADTNGNVLVTGYFSGNGVFGATVLPSSGFDDCFCAKYDSAGNVLWARAAGGLDLDLSYGVAADNLGAAWLTGFFASSSVSFDTFTLTNTGARDLFVAKLGFLPPPTLSLSFSNNQLVLLWPASAAGFGVESATQFSSPVWVTNTSSPTLVGTNFVLILPASDPGRFFRLRR